HEQADDAGREVGEFGEDFGGDFVAGDGGEGGFFGGFPDDRVAADPGEHGVPSPDGDGDVDGGDNCNGAKVMPLCHRAMGGAVGGGKSGAGEGGAVRGGGAGGTAEGGPGGGGGGGGGDVEGGQDVMSHGAPPGEWGTPL